MNTHIHMPAWVALLVKVKCIQARGNEKGPPLPPQQSPTPTTPPSFALAVFQDYQTSRLLWQPQLSSNRFASSPNHPMLFLENVISHFRLGSNSRQRTEIICGFWLCACIDNTLCPHLSHLSLFLTLPNPTLLPLSSPVLAPFTSLTLHTSPLAHFFPPHLALISPLPGLSGWFQACCIWPDLVR